MKKSRLHLRLEKLETRYVPETRPMGIRVVLVSPDGEITGTKEIVIPPRRILAGRTFKR
jgi:hypothetical protein